jgi:predicted ATPase
LHSRAAQAIEAHFSDQLDDRCSELAHHYACSDNLPKAVEFLTRAGVQAMQRSAYATAIEHLGAALAMLPGLADPAARDARELQLQAMLGSAWMATRGFAVPEVAQAYERARELCSDATASADLVRVLAGLGLLSLNRGELPLARELGEQLLGLAERRQETELFVSGHELLGHTLLRIGELAHCRTHMAQALRRCADLPSYALRDSLGRDPAISALGFGAFGLWLSGHPDQAVADAARAQRTADAATPGHPFSRAYATTSVAWVRLFRGEASLALEAAEATTGFANEHGFPSWLVHGLVVQGWAEAELGRTESGLARIEQAGRTYEATGAKVWRPLFLLVQAQALWRVRRLAEALASINRAIDHAREMGPYWWDAELIRVKGELLLAISDLNADEAQACFERSLSIGRQQGARSLELRTCVSRARLARVQGDPAPALRELAAVHDWFTEGLDTADLIEARDLLRASIPS